MLTVALTGRRGRAWLRRVFLGAAAAAFGAGIALGTSARGSAQAAANDKIPQLSGSGLGWISVGGFLDPPPGTGHGPMKMDPAYPFHGNLDGPGRVTPAIAYTKDPVLKPWAAAQMHAANDEVLSGKRGLDSCQNDHRQDDSRNGAGIYAAASMSTMCSMAWSARW